MIIGTGKVVVACWTSLLRERRSLLGRWVGWESICGSRRRKRRGGEGKKEIKSENRIVWKRGAMELKMPGQRDDFHLLPGAGIFYRHRVTSPCIRSFSASASHLFLITGGTRGGLVDGWGGDARTCHHRSLAHARTDHEIFHPPHHHHHHHHQDYEGT